MPETTINQTTLNIQTEKALASRNGKAKAPKKERASADGLRYRHWWEKLPQPGSEADKARKAYESGKGRAQLCDIYHMAEEPTNSRKQERSDQVKAQAKSKVDRKSAQYVVENPLFNAPAKASRTKSTVTKSKKVYYTQTINQRDDNKLASAREQAIEQHKQVIEKLLAQGKRDMVAVVEKAFKQRLALMV